MTVSRVSYGLVLVTRATVPSSALDQCQRLSTRGATPGPIADSDRGRAPPCRCVTTRRATRRHSGSRVRGEYWAIVRATGQGRDRITCGEESDIAYSPLCIMNDLPVDCWYSIGLYLDAFSCQCAALTCKSAYGGCSAPWFSLLTCLSATWRKHMNWDPCWSYYGTLLYRAFIEAPLSMRSWQLGTCKKIYRGPRGMVLSISFYPLDYITFGGDYSYTLKRTGWLLKRNCEKVLPRVRVEWPRDGRVFVSWDVELLTMCVI